MLRLPCVLSMVGLSAAVSFSVVGCEVTDGDDRPPGCGCIVAEADEDHDFSEPPELPICGDELLCETVVITECQDGFCGGAGSTVIENPAAIDCALAALADRTPGLLRWERDRGAQHEDLGYVLILGDGRAVVRSWGNDDLNYDVRAAEVGTLESAEHFSACIDDDDANRRYQCLRAPLAVEEGTCDEGWVLSF